MAKLLEEIRPGEILLEDFMKPMGISARQLAADTDVSPSRISELVNGQRPITADTALRLGLFFGMEPRFWLNLQSDDIRVGRLRGGAHHRPEPLCDLAGPARGELDLGGVTLPFRLGGGRPRRLAARAHCACLLTASPGACSPESSAPGADAAGKSGT